jgi:hypothetical protein
MSEQLPSVDDLLESKLPSVDEFIKEEDLPSVDEFLEKEEEVIEEETIEEPVVEAEDLTEVIRLINDVRKDIPVVPEIPEIKYYDEELEKLTAYVEEIKESIPEIPEQKTYDVEVEAICEQIDKLREEVLDLPVPKYYEQEIENLQQKVDGFYQDMMELPEPKYYEEDLKLLKEELLSIKESIPKFPKWVNEVNEVPDFSWIGKTFSVIDDDFVKVNDHLDFVKGRIDQEVQQLSETIDVKSFESKTDLDLLNKNLKETKDKIYKELREAALKIHETKHSFKNDDRLLKKNILSKYNVLKQRVEEEVKEFNRKNDATKDLYGSYFEGLTQEIANLPEVKYYDEDIKEIREEIKIDADNLKSLKELVQEIKERQIKFKQEFNEVKDLQEGLLNEPPEEKQSVDGVGDPLAPLDKQFPTLKSLADHYRLFINRTQQQIATIGGGGAGFIKDLDDVTFDQTTGTNKLLIYNGSGWVGIASTALSPIITLDDALENGNVSGIGMSVGVITATNGYFSGIVTAAQLNYDVVTDIYSTGIVTATKGIQQTGNEGLHVTAGVSTFVGLTSCLAGLHVRAGSANTALIVEGHGRITGILTIGTGSITLDSANNKVKVGTGITLDAAAGTIEVYNTTTEKVSTVVNPSGEANYTGIVTATGGVHVGTAATIYANGNISCGILTATNFIGDGSGLTGVANTDNVVSTTLSVSGVVTAIGGLYVGTAASIFANGNITGGIVTATKYYGDGSSLSNVTSTTINNNANNRLITGSGTANTLEGESTLTYDGAALSVSTGATVYTNGNIAAAGIVTANGGFVGSGANITSINGSNISSGTVAAARVATLNQDTTGTAALAEGLTGTPNIDCATGSFTGDVDIADKIIHTGDTNTAIRFPDADTITAETGGSERFRIDSSGDVGINIAAPVAQLQVNTTKNAETDRHDATNYALALRNPNDNNGEAIGLSFGITSNTTKVGAAILHERDAGGSQGSLQFYTSSDGSSVTERLRIKSDGSLNVGTAATIFANGNVTAGIVTASSFVGNGSGLTNISGIPSESDTSVSSTSATTVATFSASTYRTAFVDVQITQGSAYQAGQYALIHDGTTATIVEKVAVATGSMLGTLTATISGGNMLLQVNMGSSSSATVTVKSSTLTV